MERNLRLRLRYLTININSSVYKREGKYSRMEVRWMAVVAVEGNLAKFFDWLSENLDLENPEGKEVVLVFYLEFDEYGELRHIECKELPPKEAEKL